MTVSFTDIEGVSVDHASDLEGLTGVTVIISKFSARADFTTPVPA